MNVLLLEVNITQYDPPQLPQSIAPADQKGNK